MEIEISQSDSYPWLWDTDMDKHQFESILLGDESRPPHDFVWAISRLVEYAPYSEIKRLLPTDRFIHIWPEISSRIRSKTRRRGMDFYYEWCCCRQLNHG